MDSICDLVLTGEVKSFFLTASSCTTPDHDTCCPKRRGLEGSFLFFFGRLSNLSGKIFLILTPCAISSSS